VTRLCRVFLALAVAAVALLAAACGGSTADAGPPEINYGRDVCVDCNMIISEAKHAAAYRLADGTEKLFDDVGGMVKHGRASGDFASATVWVHDYETEEWVEVGDAFFVPTLAVTSPMGHGIIAFGDRARADAFAAAVDGEVIDWATVLEMPLVDGLLGDHHDNQENHEEDSP
jgi:copper chaperone NosL